MNPKLLVTLGPSSLNEQVITDCDKFGIFVFRINLSHTPLDKVEETIQTIKKYTNTPICLDSEGAQIRNQRMAGGAVYLKKDGIVKIHYNEVEGDSSNISFTPSFVAQELRVGDELEIDFHSVSLRVTEIGADGCQAVVLEDGQVGSNKAVELNRKLDLPPITLKDEGAIEIGKKLGISHFALSFASSMADVKYFRSRIGDDSYLMSKVESLSGVKNLDDIINSSDAILIDRGDLSRQIPIEKIPFFQRRIISCARSKNKDVFVATNLLESMVTSKNPTRAEVNDIVSTRLMGATGLVLAAETAIGEYPVECVKMTRELLEQCERWTPNTSLEELL